MKIVQDENLPQMGYPVGSYMSKNLMVIDAMADILIEKYGKRGINLWCRGSSGAIVSAIISQKYLNNGGEVKISHVKKEGETAHGKTPPFDREFLNIIVDDIIESGATIEAIIKCMGYYINTPSIDLVLVSSSVNNKVLNMLRAHQVEELICEEIY